MFLLARRCRDRYKARVVHRKTTRGTGYGASTQPSFTKALVSGTNHRSDNVPRSDGQPAIKTNPPSRTPPKSGANWHQARPAGLESCRPPVDPINELFACRTASSSTDWNRFLPGQSCKDWLTYTARRAAPLTGWFLLASCLQPPRVDCEPSPDDGSRSRMSTVSGPGTARRLPFPPASGRTRPTRRTSRARDRGTILASQRTRPTRVKECPARTADQHHMQDHRQLVHRRRERVSISYRFTDRRSGHRRPANKGSPRQDRRSPERWKSGGPGATTASSAFERLTAANIRYVGATRRRADPVPARNRPARHSRSTEGAACGDTLARCGRNPSSNVTETSRGTGPCDPDAAAWY